MIKGRTSSAKLKLFGRESEADAGFTLIEVLVTLSLLALMAVLTTTFLSQLGIFNNRQNGRTFQQEADAAARYIERTLENALALPIDVNDNSSRVFFHGESKRVTFVTQSRSGISEAATRTVQIGATASSGATLRQTIIQRRFGDSTRRLPARSVVIVDNVGDLSFLYLDQNDEGRPIWVANWNKERSLPTAVRFSLSLRRQGDRYNSDGSARIFSAIFLP